MKLLRWEQMTKAQQDELLAHYRAQMKTGQRCEWETGQPCGRLGAWLFHRQLRHKLNTGCW